MTEGWHVEAEGNIYREAREFRIEVTSGIDWFELHGTVDFGDAKANLPELIAALKRGDNSVLLGDGTFGVAPGRVVEEVRAARQPWLNRRRITSDLPEARSDCWTRCWRRNPKRASTRRTRERAMSCSGSKAYRAADPPPSFQREVAGLSARGAWVA